MNLKKWIETLDANKKPTAANVVGFYTNVTKQALYHNTRSDYSELFKRARPNEEKIYTDYRNDNKRRITVDVINRFKSMLKRTFENSFDEIKADFYPEINEKKYQLLELSMVDPNALQFDWPYNQKNPDTPPSFPIELGGLVQTEKINYFETTLYSSNIIDYVKGSHLIYLAGKVEVKKGKFEDYFHMIDDTSYFRLLPFESESKIKYEVQEWYVHNMGYLPVAELPGIPTFVEDLSAMYKESYAFSAYEILDEVINAFSTDQVNRSRHLSPKLVTVGEIECPACNGTRKKEGATCGSCSGTGSLVTVGDFSTLKLKPPGSNFDSSNVSLGQNPIYYLQPSGGLEYSKEVWESLLDRAEKCLATDPLEGTGNESGVAKEMRLEPRQDIIEAIGQDFHRMITEMIYFRYRLLFIDEKEIPVFKLPIQYNTKTIDVLRHELKNALPAEKYTRFFEYINRVYKGDDFMQKVYEVSVLYAPLMLYNAEEILSAVGSGAYNEQDIIKKDFAVYLIKTILKSNPKLDNAKIFEMCDEMLREMGKLPQIELTGTSLDDLMELNTGQNKDLTSTVGGVQGLIGLSSAVSKGEMSEDAAENILKIVYGFTSEQANKLISVPVKLDPEKVPDAI